MNSLNLPNFNIPELPQKHLTPTAFHTWVVRNVKLLHDSGRLRLIRRQPERHPVDARFVLK